MRLVDTDVITLFVSQDILEEVRQVLSRPKIRQKNSTLTNERIGVFLRRLAEKAALVDDVQQHFTYARDPKDEKYINLALEVTATYLVSRDKDLLDLTTSNAEE